jgi:uncharacterized repeat protein (TIGR01451 family)
MARSISSLLIFPARALAALLVCAAAMLVPLSDAAAGRIEAGTFTAHDTFGTGVDPQFVPFQQTFDVPPVVIVLSNSNGGQSASVRITNVTTAGFEELILEPDGWDGHHLEMATQYIAVEPGRHVLPDGTIIEAGRTNVSAVQFGTGFSGGAASWATINFSAPLPGTPTVIHQLQTANSETRDVAEVTSRPHITSIVQSPTISGFQAAIDRSQANSGPFPTSEQIGWIAFPQGGTGSFPNTAGTTINWASVTSGFFLRGWDEGCQSTGIGLTASNPVVVAKKLSRNNADGGWLRNCTVSSNAVTLRVDEDTDQDGERSIAAGDAERVGIVSFSQAFHALLEAELDVTKALIAADDQQGGDFRVPGALVDYLITVSNSGNAPPNYESVVVTDALPPELALVVSDFGAAGSGPVDFTDGSPATGLTCPFVSLASSTDCISFSTDGTNFGYTPSDSGDGTDPAVTHIRITPIGAMAGDTGSGDPNFELRLRARIR